MPVGLLLEPSRYEPRVFGDERCEVPVGGLTIGALFDRRSAGQVDSVVAFLGITEPEYVERRDRRRRESKLSTERVQARYPEKVDPADPEYSANLGVLVGDLAIGRGFRPASADRWQVQRKGVKMSLLLTPSRRGRLESRRYLCDVTLTCSDGLGEPERRQNAYCQDSIVCRFTVQAVPRWRFSLWEVEGELAEQGFLRSVENLLDIGDWVTAEAGRFRYVREQNQRILEFNIAAKNG